MGGYQSGIIGSVGNHPDGAYFWLAPVWALNHAIYDIFSSESPFNFG